MERNIITEVTERNGEWGTNGVTCACVFVFVCVCIRARICVYKQRRVWKQITERDASVSVAVGGDGRPRRRWTKAVAILSGLLFVSSLAFCLRLTSRFLLFSFLSCISFSPFFLRIYTIDLPLLLV